MSERPDAAADDRITQSPQAPTNVADAIQAFSDAWAPDPVVLSRLKCRVREDEPPEPLRCPENIEMILEEDPRWAGRIQLDTFAGVLSLEGERASDEDVTRLRTWLSRVYGLIVPDVELHHMLADIARRHPCHPIREYLDGLAWDGQYRLSDWLSIYFGVESTSYVRAVARAWLISAVARVYQPGCKVDTVPVLIGAQGAMKSSALRVLASDPWFTDSSFDVHDKDAFLTISGSWFIEVPELDAFSRRENAAIKAFLSSRVDKYRPPYGRIAIQRPRQCVIVGTTNHETFLSDVTGTRRYWPIVVRTIDLVALERDRDQLWAEAVCAYRDHEPWWLSPEMEQEREVVSEEHVIVDAWEESIADWVEGRRDVTIVEIAHGTLGLVGLATITRAVETRIGTILHRLGWRVHRPHRGQRIYRRE